MFGGESVEFKVAAPAQQVTDDESYDEDEITLISGL